MICNCSGNTAWVCVYRENGGVIERGWVDERGYYAGELGLNNMMGNNSFYERYEPEQGAFVVDGWDMEDGSERTESFWGLEHFEFQEFSHRNY